MGPESKGRAWLGKIYNKLETILLEVDTFTSQSTLCLNSSDPSGWESVRGEADEYAEDCSSDLQQHHDRLALPSCVCDSPSNPPSPQNFDISRNVRVEEQVEKDIMKENLLVSSLSDGETFSGAPLLQEYCDGNLTSATTLGDDEEPITTDKESQITNTLAPQKYSTDDSNLNPTDTKFPDAPVQDNVANMRSSNEDNPNDVIHDKSDAAPLDTRALSGLAFLEDPSYVDENALYAVRVRTKKLRSLKRKIIDALTTKRRREKDYEQLAIWFGDADMSSDLVKEDSEYTEAIDSKSSQVHEIDDSQWELL